MSGLWLWSWLILWSTLGVCEGAVQGVLRVRITSFSNRLSQVADGSCCLHHWRPSTCSRHCRTFFRVCVTYRVRPAHTLAMAAHPVRVEGGGVRASSGRGLEGPCPLGLLVTEVVTNSSLLARLHGALDLTFPFTQPWQVRFKLIVEAWHDVTGKLFSMEEPVMERDGLGQLIARHEGHHVVRSGHPWSHHAHANDHTTLHYALKVICVDPFHGTRCTQCSEGWTGEDCQQPVCREGCHPEHGNCSRPGQCRCAPGWGGPLCSECVKPTNCEHGSCTANEPCVCHEGWSGPMCTRPKCREDCHPGHGYCDQPGECKCRIGWSGPTCQECKPLLGCVNGVCTKPLECRCKPGWTGPLCQTPVCAEGCNKTHGYCNKPLECRCEVGWWGEKCDMCFPYPGCKHGNCSEPWECVCHPGWTGLLCDTSNGERGFCQRHAGLCLNGGTCIDTPGGQNYTCSCPSLFTGQRCDYLADMTMDTAGTSRSRETGNIFSTGTRQNIQVILPDAPSPRGNDSLLQPMMTAPKAQGEMMNQEDAKDARRRFLQKHARISFRQPKLVHSEEGSDKLPFTVVERKLLPLPVVLPRVSEIIPSKLHFTRELKPAAKQPTPILILDPGASEDNQDKMQVRNSLQQTPQSSGRNHINENRRFLRHQQGSPGLLPDPDDSILEDAPRARPVLVKVLNSQHRPILVSAQARVLPRPKAISPVPIRTGPRPRQRSQPQRRPATPSTFPNIEELSTTPTPIEEALWEQLTSDSSLSPTVTTLEHSAEETESQEDLVQTYYNENINGRVHIGDISSVDDAAPLEEIFDAFIELKKV
ncbi:uncharacterized protein [Panulirus ornatus]|uniref:uncharacterized protein n=1 Tax=Panulirus ornatus TaxID=150431 RepID=UPI003A8948C8